MLRPLAPIALFALLAGCEGPSETTPADDVAADTTPAAPTAAELARLHRRANAQTSADDPTPVCIAAARTWIPANLSNVRGPWLAVVQRWRAACAGLPGF